MVFLGDILGLILKKPAGLILLFLAVSLIAIIVIMFSSRGKIRAWYIIMPLFMIVTFAVSSKSQNEYQVRPDTIYQIEGKVNKVVDKSGYTQIYLYNPSICEGGAAVSLTGLIVNYTGESEVIRGMRIMLSGKIKEYENARNPGNFDEAVYYSTMNVTNYLWSDNLEVLTKAPRIYEIIFNFKKRLINVYRTIAPENDAGIYASIVLGDKSFLNSDIKSLYQSGGMGHILAISGLHIAIIGMGLYKLLRKLLVPFLPCFLTCFGVIVTYGIMTGSSVSTIRAVIMFLMSIFAGVLGRKYDILSSLSLSAIVILLTYPKMIFNSGFWLSTLAVAGIVLIKPAFDELLGDKKNSITDAFFASLSVNIATFPVILISYFEIPLYSVFLNMLVLPLMSLLMVSVLLGGLFGLLWIPLGTFFVGPAHFILLLYELICRLFLSLPFSVLIIGRPMKMQIFFYVILVALAVILCLHLRKELLLLIPAAFIIICIHFPKDFQTVMLDVGQGDCIHITSSGKHLLIDGGSSDVKNVGKYRIIPYLKSQGIDELDYVVMTHGDTDHVNGLLEIMNSSNIKIKYLILPKLDAGTENYEMVKNEAFKNNIQVAYILAGMEFNCGNVSLKCLHPSSGYKYSSENEYSVVLKASYGEFDMLFTGDLDDVAEQHLLLHSAFDDIELLKVAHHGSKYSTSNDFLMRVKPETALISCGLNNKYGHPHEETMERLKYIGANVMRTDECGAIIIEIKKDDVRVRGYVRP
ncbi:MAG: DNA internalization-related competence protein ComEC/Rec2 [Lachnospiraceae bacterium]